MENSASVSQNASSKFPGNAVGFPTQADIFFNLHNYLMAV